MLYFPLSETQKKEQRGIKTCMIPSRHDVPPSTTAPLACIRGDTLWVIYSVMKEEIEVCSIPLESI